MALLLSLNFKGEGLEVHTGDVNHSVERNREDHCGCSLLDNRGRSFSYWLEPHEMGKTHVIFVYAQRVLTQIKPSLAPDPTLEPFLFDIGIPSSDDCRGGLCSYLRLMMPSATYTDFTVRMQN